MENKLSQNLSSQLKQFIKRLKMLAWLEGFERWFSFSIKLLWVGLFIAFGLYVYKEYKKDVVYLQDFKVPLSWAEKGYTGEVVRESIADKIDEINKERLEFWGYTENNYGSYKEDDETQILSDITVEGFNLRAIIKSILVILGKKQKNIGGYITLSDSLQTISIQVTGQITQPISISRKEPIDNLIRKATFEIMKIKQPLVLLNYYEAKKDSLSLTKTYRFLEAHRALINDFNFYLASMGHSLYKKNYTKANAWADSMLKQYPDDMRSYTNKAKAYQFWIYYGQIDNTTKKKIQTAVCRLS